VCWEGRLAIKSSYTVLVEGVADEGLIAEKFADFLSPRVRLSPLAELLNSRHDLMGVEHSGPTKDIP